MPAVKLRSLNSTFHHSSPSSSTRYQNRKSVSMTLSSLASRRKAANLKRTSSRRLSSTAEKVLDDGDQSDGDSYKQVTQDKRHNVTTALTATPPASPVPIVTVEKSVTTAAMAASAAEEYKKQSSFSSIAVRRSFEDDAADKYFLQEVHNSNAVAMQNDDAFVVAPFEANFPHVPPKKFSSTNTTRAAVKKHGVAIDNEHLLFAAFEPNFPDDEYSPMVQSKKSIDAPSAEEEEESIMMGYVHTVDHPPSSSHDRKNNDGVKLNVKYGDKINVSITDVANEHTLENVGVNTKDEDDEIIRAGNEAILFVYGHNANLYNDVFHLPSPNCTNGQIANSYENQMSLLSYALEMITDSLATQPLEQEQVAIECGMQPKGQHSFLHPKNFVEIKLDAVERAFAILMDERSRQEYDGLWKEFEHDFGDEDNTSAGNGTVETAAETLTATTEMESSPGVEGGKFVGGVVDDFWGEEYFAQRQVSGKADEGTSNVSPITEGYLEADEYHDPDEEVYGTHGDYSYDCQEDEYDNDGDEYYEDEVPVQTEVTGNHSFKSEDDQQEEDQQDYPCTSRDGVVHCPHYHVSENPFEEGDSCTSPLEYSYNSGDEYEDQEYEQEESTEATALVCTLPRRDSEDDEELEDLEYEEEYDTATVQTEAVTVQTEELIGRNTDKRKGQHHQRSPTDPMEFDALIQDSLPDSAYFSQFSSGAATTTPSSDKSSSASAKKKINKGNNEDFVFDPFNLQDLGSNVSSVKSNSFPEEAIYNDGSYVDATAPLKTDGSSEGSTVSVAYVCALPSRDDSSDDSEEEGGLTMGDMIARQEQQGVNRNTSLVDNMSVMSDYTDEESVSTSSALSRYTTDSLAFSESVSTSAHSRSKSKKKKLSSFKSKVRHMLSSVTSSVGAHSKASIDSFDDMTLETMSLDEQQGPKSSRAVNVVGLSPGSAVSRLTDADGVEDGLYCFNGKEEAPTSPSSPDVGLDCFNGNDEDEAPESPSSPGINVPILEDQEYPQDGMIDVVSPVKKQAEPDGPNMSVDGEEDEDDDEMDEIETFLSIASTFSAMNKKAVANKSSGNKEVETESSSAVSVKDLIHAKFSNSEEEDNEAVATTSREYIKTKGNMERRQAMLAVAKSRSTDSSNDDGSNAVLDVAKSRSAESSNYDGIDCFPDEEEEGRAVRFNVEEEEFEYNSTASVGGDDGGVVASNRSCFDVCIDSIDDSLTTVEKLCGVSR